MLIMQIGELQCYDRRALASLAQAAQDRGHPEWGYTGPHDAGSYTSNPEVRLCPCSYCTNPSLITLLSMPCQSLIQSSL